MSVIINTEHFSLSEKSRKNLESILQKLDPLVYEDASVRLFIKKEPKHSLTAILHVHTRGKDYVATKVGEDLEDVVASAETQVRKRLLLMKDKSVHLRKRAAS